MYTQQTQLLLPSYRVHVLCANAVSQLNSRLRPSCNFDLGGSRHGWEFSRRKTCYLQMSPRETQVDHWWNGPLQFSCRRFTFDLAVCQGSLDHPPIYNQRQETSTTLSLSSFTEMDTHFMKHHLLDVISVFISAAALYKAHCVR